MTVSTSLNDSSNGIWYIMALWYIMVHHGTISTVFCGFGDYLKIESKFRVKCALATACCLGSLGKPLDACPFYNGCKNRNQVKILEVRFKHRRACLDASLLIFWPVSYFFHAPWGLLVLSKGTDLCLQTLQPAESILLVLWSSKHLDRQMRLHPAKLKIAPKKLAWKPFGMESKMVRLEGFGGLHLFAWYKLAPCCWSFWKTH